MSARCTPVAQAAALEQQQQLRQQQVTIRMSVLPPPAPANQHDGDVCNKVGTYLKALAANDNDIPFYVCLPSSTIDWTLCDGVTDIPIEQRDATEVSHVNGKTSRGEVIDVQITPDETAVANYAFDVTPARLVTGLITERGVFDADRTELEQAFEDLIPAG